MPPVKRREARHFAEILSSLLGEGDRLNVEVPLNAAKRHGTFVVRIFRPSRSGR
jgi:hypothetical protein